MKSMLLSLPPISDRGFPPISIRPCGRFSIHLGMPGNTKIIIIRQNQLDFVPGLIYHIVDDQPQSLQIEIFFIEECHCTGL
jgi:hypothetical protein